MLRQLVLAAVGGIMLACGLAGSAAAATQTINHPTYNGNRLDWCVNWGVGCGKQAADAYCKAIGFQSATGFQEDHDIGLSSPTRLIGTGAVCDQGFCDGFKAITCYKPDPFQTFANPVYNGNRLDWCFNWGQGCGKPAADAYCKSKGYGQAVAFSEAHDIGLTSPTRLIGTGAICDQGFCDGFQAITCAP